MESAYTRRRLKPAATFRRVIPAEVSEISLSLQSFKDGVLKEARPLPKRLIYTVSPEWNDYVHKGGFSCEPDIADNVGNVQRLQLPAH